MSEYFVKSHTLAFCPNMNAFFFFFWPLKLENLLGGWIVSLFTWVQGLFFFFYPRLCSVFFCRLLIDQQFHTFRVALACSWHFFFLFLGDRNIFVYKNARVCKRIVRVDSASSNKSFLCHFCTSCDCFLFELKRVFHMWRSSKYFSFKPYFNTLKTY